MKLLIKVFVREYYLANSSFFLLVIAFAGGFMRSYDHIALAEFFISSVVVLGIPIALWVIYSVHVLNFNLELLTRKENEFIFNISIMPVRNQWLMLTRVILLQELPILFYGLFLCLMAWKHGFVESILYIIVAFGVLIYLTTFKFKSALQSPDQEKKVTVLSKFLNTKFTKRFPFFFIEWIARHELIMLIGTKFFSTSILLTATYLYKTDEYDIRLLGLGIAIAFAGNINIVYAMHRFDNYKLDWLKGLPIPFLKKVLFYAITITTLLLPELGIIIKNFPAGLTLADEISAILFGVSIPLLFYGILYTKDRDQEKIMRFVCSLALVWLLLILFKIPLILLGILNLSLGLFLWKRFYYSFEYISKMND